MSKVAGMESKIPTTTGPNSKMQYDTENEIWKKLNILIKKENEKPI